MEKKVIELEIIDEIEESGTQKISLVDAPAIEKDWMYFKKVEQFVKPEAGESESDYMGRCVPTMIDEGKPQDQAVAICISTYENMNKVFEFDAFADYPWDECIDDANKRGLDDESAARLCGWIKANMQSVEKFQESYTDYPEAAKQNAARALKWAEENGWGDCGTPVGKARANQLAKGEPISIDTVARMASFERHRQNSDTPYGEGCGKLMWDAWGGDEGIAWAQRTLESYNNVELGIDTGGLAPYTQQAPIKKKDLVEESVNFSAILDKARTLGFSAEDFTSNGLETVDEDQYISLKLAKGYTVYKYSGSVTENTRDFCREMVNMDRYYTFDEINQLSATDPNPGFGLGGSDNYSIWKYKGGPNCKHRWQKFYVTEKGTIQNKGAAPGTAGEKPIDMPNNGYAFAQVEDLKVGDAVSWKTADQNPRGRIKEITYRSKIVPGTGFRIEGTQDDPGYIIEIYERVDGKWSPTGKFVGRKANSILKNVELWRQTFAQVEDKRELVGAVAIPDMEIYRRDKDGNPYYVKFSKDVIRRMAEKFMREQKLAETNIAHQEIEAETYIFESWIVEHQEDKANNVYGLDVPIGSWVIKARVTNDNVWEAVKEGKLKGFSLEGDFVSKEEYEEYMQTKKMYENLISLVKGL